MIQTIRVSALDQQDDLLGRDLRAAFTGDISLIRTARVYRLEGVSLKDAKQLAQKLLSESINQEYRINASPIIGATDVVEIAYKPGVMNPEVASILKASLDLGIKLKAADASREYYFFKSQHPAKIRNRLAELNLFNQTVEYIVEHEPKTLTISGKPGPTLTIPLRGMSEQELVNLSADSLFLSLTEMQAIQHFFQELGRDPLDCELETLAQTWSEHCAHKTFKAELVVDGKKKKPMIKRIMEEALRHDKLIVSAFVDNSGVMDFYDGLAICGKVETHNSPSAIEPYGGAMTGSGGVFRDVLGTGQGAKPISSTDMFCFAPWDLSEQALPPGCLPPEYLLKRVVAGVRDYGNRIGIPTNNGSVHFHKDFRAKPSVIVGAYGLLPKKRAQKGTPKVGDLIIVVGGRTGRDGIHGATFSSAAMTDRTISVNSSAVQIGNAVEEKRMFDALLMARDRGLIRAMQDCGAGGFSSAIGEMGEETGVHVQLKRAPLKYMGLSPWEIWVSESQERMVAAVPKGKRQEFLSLCKTYNVEAAVLGYFDGSKRLNVYYGRRKICNLHMDFLHHGLPKRTMEANKPVGKFHNENFIASTSYQSEKDWLAVLKGILAHGNVCSKEPIVRLYDHSVQGTNDLQPYSGVKLDGPNDAVVLRPLLDKPYGVIVAHGLNPVLNNIDPYWGSIWAGVEALANYVSVGGDYRQASLINNYIWPVPDNDSLWSLDRSVDAVCDVMKTFTIPVISGKDSLSSTYKGKDGTVIKIPPVLCMSVFGRIEDTDKTVSADFKKEGSIICLVGKPDFQAMGGSVYFDTQKVLGDEVPHMELSLLPKIFRALHKAISRGEILASHDISEGGMITSLFEMCVGGEMGAEIDLAVFKNIRPDYALFNETAGCFIVEVRDRKTAETVFASVPHALLGKTKQDKTITVKNSKELFNADLEKLKKAWKLPMERMF